MITPEHQALIDKCQSLIFLWEAEKARLERNAVVDRKVHLPHTADVEEASALVMKGCVNGLKDALEKETVKVDNSAIPSP